MTNRVLMMCCCLTLILVGFSRAQYVQADGRQGPDYVKSQAMLRILSRAKVSGSLEYSGLCPERQLPDFPKANMALKSENEPPLQAFQDMFEDEPGMQVTQEPDGTIRIIGKGVSLDLLTVKIGHISFEIESEVHALGDKGVPLLCSVQPPEACASIRVLKSGCSTGECIKGAYDAQTAAGAIMHAPEVQAFMKAHDIDLIWGPVHGPMLEGITVPSSVHISGNLDNVTVSQALDHVLKTFPGFWVYEDCADHAVQDKVFLRFFTVPSSSSK